MAMDSNNMNDKLPSEILYSIIWYLPLRGKVTCLRVSKTWYNMLMKDKVYEELDFKNIDRLGQALKIFRQRPQLGQQVKQLSLMKSVLKFRNGHINDIASIPQLLPNTKTFKCMQDEDQDKPYPISFRVFCMTQWKFTGHKRDNNRIFLNVSATLLSGAAACSFLTNLEVSFQDYAGSRKPFESSDLTDNLHNAPVLKQLTLRDIRKLCIGDLAILHSQSPMLQDPALENVNLKRESMPISNVDNSPAQNLRSFTLAYFIVEPERWHPGYPVKKEEELTIMEWFDFFGEKYKCIESLEMFHENHV